MNTINPRKTALALIIASTALYGASAFAVDDHASSTGQDASAATIENGANHAATEAQDHANQNAAVETGDGVSVDVTEANESSADAENSGEDANDALSNAQDKASADAEKGLSTATDAVSGQGDDAADSADSSASEAADSAESEADDASQHASDEANTEVDSNTGLSNEGDHTSSPSGN